MESTGRERSVETGPYMEALTLFVRESKARRKATHRRLCAAFSTAGFRAISLFGTLGSWGHGRQTGKADLSGLDDNLLSASVYSHQDLEGTTRAVMTPLLSAQMLLVLTGGRICEAAFSSFLLLVAAGTHRRGACSCCFLGPRGWLSVLSPAVPPH